MRNYFNSQGFVPTGFLVRTLATAPSMYTRPTNEHSTTTGWLWSQAHKMARQTTIIQIVLTILLSMMLLAIPNRVHVHASTPYLIPKVIATTVSTTPAVVASTDVVSGSWFENFSKKLDFTQVLILILVAALFFKDELRLVLRKYFGGDIPFDQRTPVEKKTEVMMGQLVQHYNHETTGILTEILQELKYVRKDQNVQGEKLNAIIGKVEEMIKYGVPERKS